MNYPDVGCRKLESHLKVRLRHPPNDLNRRRLMIVDFSGLLSYAVLHINKGGLAVRAHRCPLLRRLNRIT